MAKDPTRIPRPPNAFILYRAEFQKNVQTSVDPHDSKGPANRCNQVSKDAGVSWHLQPAQVQAKYYRLAEEAKKAHARNYPGYKYAPARKGSNKKLPKKQSRPVRKVTAVTTASPSPSPLSSFSAVSTSTASGSQSPSSSSRNTELETLAAPQSSQNAPRRPDSPHYHSHTQLAMSHSMPGQSMLWRDPSAIATVYPLLQLPTSTSDIHPAMPPHPCALELSQTEAGQSMLQRDPSAIATVYPLLQLPTSTSDIAMPPHPCAVRAPTMIASETYFELSQTEAAPPSNRLNHGATPMRANSMADLSDAMFAPCAQPWQRNTALPDAPFTNAPREFDSRFPLSNTELDMSYHPVAYPTPTSQHAIDTATHRLSSIMTVPEALEYVNAVTERARLLAQVLIRTNELKTAPSPSDDLAASFLTDQGQMEASPEYDLWSNMKETDGVFRFVESEDSQADDMTL